MNDASTSLREQDDLLFSGSKTLETDVLVIGSGLGGLATALTASELGHSVLILEEGASLPTPVAPARSTEEQASLHRHYGPISSFGTHSIKFSEAKCLGGSSEIGPTLFQKTPSLLLSEWQTNYDINDFGALALNPHYEWASGVINPQSPQGILSPSSELLREAAFGMGWEHKYLEQRQRNFGLLLATHPDHSHTNLCSLASDIMATLLQRRVKVSTKTKVKKITMKGPWVRSIKAQATCVNGKKQRLHISARKIFVCAGVIQTPVLLKKSGLHKNIGNQLRMHPTLSCLAFFDKIMDAQNYYTSPTVITEFMPDLYFRDAAFTPSLFGQALTEDWEGRSQYIQHVRQATLSQVIVRGQGLGHIHTVPWSTNPIVTYKMADDDKQKLCKGMSLLGQSLLKAGAHIVIPAYRGHHGWQSTDEAFDEQNNVALIQKAIVSSSHIFSSCPMGENPDKCAVDSFGRVHGTSNLFVADASILPEAPGVNPEATIMALAHRNARHVLTHLT